MYVDLIMLPLGSRMLMGYVATCRFEYGVVMKIQLLVASLSAINVEFIVVVVGVSALSKTNFCICL